MLGKLSLASAAAKAKAAGQATTAQKAELGIGPEQSLTVTDYLSNKRAKENQEDTAPTLTDDELDLPAILYLRTGQMLPAGMGKQGLKLREAVVRRATAIGKTIGASGDIAANKAQLGADQKSYTGIQTNLDAVNAFTRTVHSNAQVMLTAAAKAPDTGSPLLNELARGVAGHVLGDPDVAAFRTSLQSVRPEFARILNNPTMGGTPITDADKKNLQATLGDNFTRKQLRASVAILFRDAENRRSGYQTQLDQIGKRMRWRGLMTLPLTQLGPGQAGVGEQPAADPLGVR
jgi:hypothetical protein